VLNIVVNHQAKGDFFVTMTPERDFLIRVSDLVQMGFKKDLGPVVDINGEPHIAVRSIQGVRVEFNERSLTLTITAMPFVLEKTTLDFDSSRRLSIAPTEDLTGFLNYRLNVLNERTNVLSSNRMDLTTQVGLQRKNLLFLSDSVYTKSDHVNGLVRLMTNVTADLADTKQRVIIGDFFAPTGDFGGNINLGGISLQKSYVTDPYFIRYPTVNLAGSVSLPSDIDVYLGGVPIRRERISPGDFELRNISWREGAGLLEIVLRDPFGREERLVYPFYMTGVLLKRGLHDYSYNIGAPREQFGVRGFEYGGPVLSGLHRYGVRDDLTAQFGLEASNRLYNLGPAASFRIRTAGVSTLAFSGSKNDVGQMGWAGSATYSYQEKRFFSQVAARYLSPHYTSLLLDATANPLRHEISAGVGYGTPGFGTMSLDHVRQDTYVGASRAVTTLGFTSALRDGFNVVTTFRRTDGVVTAYEFIVALNYYPRNKNSASTQFRSGGGGNTSTVQIQRDFPTGEGFGGRLRYETSTAADRPENNLDGIAQYNTRFGIYTGNYRVIDGHGHGHSTAELSAAGGVAYVGGAVGLSRPITDSFALVEVENLEGVSVYYNSQEVGRTGPLGKLFIPDLRPYSDNQISIGDRDIPMDYSISEAARSVSPPYRGGSYVKFEANKFQAITGTISIRINGKTEPVEFQEVSLITTAQPIRFPTGRGGEFYLENIPPGRHRASVTYAGTPCSFHLMIPQTDEFMIDLGALTCEPESAPNRP
jgi:outer membrane usher protein FimD/PapC